MRVIISMLIFLVISGNINYSNSQEIIFSDFRKGQSNRDEIRRYEFSRAMNEAIMNHAVKKRQHPVMNRCAISFDGCSDMFGNEIFKVDMTVNPFSIYELDEYMGFTMFGNVQAFIKDTEYAREHATLAKDKYYPISDPDNYWWIPILYHGIYEIMNVGHETFYFVIKGDTVEPFSKVKMERVEPVLYRPYTGKAGPIINTGGPKQHKKPWYRR